MKAPRSPSSARRELALEAFHELKALLCLLTQVDADSVHALRGLAIRSQALLLVLYTSAIEPSFSSIEDDAAILQGRLAAGGGSDAG